MNEELDGIESTGNTFSKEKSIDKGTPGSM